MRCFKPKLLTLSALLLASLFFGELSFAAGDTRYAGIGRTPDPALIKKWDIAVGPSGKELPPGSGTAAQGEKIYASQCASCHGATGTEGPSFILVNKTGNRYPGVAGFPYFTTVWDYINRAMPLGVEGTLSADDVYALTAFLLYKNGIIAERDVMNAKTLPKLVSPVRDTTFPKISDIWWEPNVPRKYGLYPVYPLPGDPDWKKP